MITVVGHTAYDYIFNVENHPLLNHSSYILKWNKFYGGGGANIAVGISKFGIKSKLYSAIGIDGKRYENYLKKLGISLNFYRSNKKTARAFIFNSKKGQKMYFYWGASEEMEKMRGIKSEILHIAPCHPKLAIKMAENSEFFAFEPGQDLKKYCKEEIEYMIENADIIFCNEIEYKYLKKFEIRGNIIVTLGNKGSIIYKSGKRIPAIPSKQIDATGAGDAYKAGFWFGLLNGYDLEVCCKLGSISASFVIEKMGAQNFPNLEKLKNRYEKYFGKLKFC